MTIWFSSDPHFQHKNILKFQPERPWKTVEEMDEGIIELYNKFVKPEDTLYLLGDLGFAPPTVLGPLLGRINGTKRHIRGNHDRSHAMINCNFEWTRDYYELREEVNGVREHLVLCHYPMRAWNKAHHGSWNIHGHCHGSLPPNGKQIDVGIDATILYDEWYGTDAGVEPFGPVSLEQLQVLMATREIFTEDHHHPKADLGAM
jgi:calcineurin-like phosphoesterase family protein